MCQLILLLQQENAYRHQVLTLAQEKEKIREEEVVKACGPGTYNLDMKSKCAGKHNMSELGLQLVPFKLNDRLKYETIPQPFSPSSN